MEKKNYFLGIVLILLPALVFGFAEHKMEKSFTVKKGGELIVDADIGSIDVSAHNKNIVEAVIYFKSKHGSEKDLMDQIDEFDIHLSRTGDNVHIELKRDRHKDWWGNNNRLQIHFDIIVPKEYNVNLNTSGGSISVKDLDGNAACRTSGGSLYFGFIKGLIDGNTSGGSISIEGCEGDVGVKTSGGGIRIGRAKGSVEAFTSGGSIDVEEVFGNIEAKTSGGHVNCTLTKQPTSDCMLQTSGGSIKVNIKRDIRLSLDASTSGGRVSTDFPVTVKGKLNGHRLNTDINGGGPTLTLRTSGGGIHIHEI